LALQALALTFVRTSELIGATWDEFDFGKALWAIPATRMKMGKEHVVPLSTQALQVFKALKKIAGNSAWVLPGRNPIKPISNNSMLFALYRLGYRGQMTGHGFRSVASTALNESNGFQTDWVERQLAHSPANEVAGAYNKAKYLPARKKMMQWYGDFLDTQAGGDLFDPLPLKS
jgi:integrase